jgi:hypothetical protein
MIRLILPFLALVGFIFPGCVVSGPLLSILALLIWYNHKGSSLDDVRPDSFVFHQLIKSIILQASGGHLVREPHVRGQSFT